MSSMFLKLYLFFSWNFSEFFNLNFLNFNKLSYSQTCAIAFMPQPIFTTTFNYNDAQGCSLFEQFGSIHISMYALRGVGLWRIFLCPTGGGFENMTFLHMYFLLMNPFWICHIRREVWLYVCQSKYSKNFDILMFKLSHTFVNINFQLPITLLSQKFKTNLKSVKTSFLTD